MEYTLDGIIWETLDEEYIGNSDGGNNYGWQLPEMLSSHVQYRITDAQDPLKTDVSNVGQLVAPPYGVELLSPNGFESFIAGTTQQINYELKRNYMLCGCNEQLASYEWRQIKRKQGLTLII